jgi:hypothetical protein
MDKKPDQLEYVKSQGFDSIEEWEFGQWCEEAKWLGILTGYKHHPDPFKLSERVSIQVEKQLKTKTKMEEVFLLHPHEYTCDYKIIVDPEKWNKANLPKDPKLVVTTETLAPPFGLGVGSGLYVDVKGSFSPYHDAKQFSINRKWVWEKYQVLIQEIVPEEWFKKTWVPAVALVTWKTGKPRDKYRGRPTKETVLELLK